MRLFMFEHSKASEPGLGRRKFSFGRNAALRSILVDGMGKFPRQPCSSSSRDNPVCFDNVSSTSGPIASPSCGCDIGLLEPVPTQRVRDFPMAFLLETVNQFAKAAA